MLIKNSVNAKGSALDVVAKASVAAAVASMCVGTAYSLTIASRSADTSGALSREKLANTSSTATAALGTITLTLGSTYNQNDEVTFTVGGGSINPTATATLGCTGNVNFAEITSASSSTARKFRAPSSVTADTLCTLSGLFLLESSVSATAGATVTLSSSSERIANNAAFDAGSAQTISTVVDEYGIRVTRFDALVDARKNNKIFTDSAISDKLTITVTNRQTANDIALSSGTRSLVIDVMGDFDFLFNTGETLTQTNNTSVLGGLNSAVASAGALTALGTGADVTGLRLTVSGAVANGDAYSIDIIGADSASANSITAQDFDSSSLGTFYFTTGSEGAPNNSFDPGAFGASGATVFVPYMPINRGTGSDSIVNTLFLINNSGSAGSVTMSARSETGASCTQSGSTSVGANRATSLGTAFRNMIDACIATGTVATVDKVFVTISSTTPIATTEVYSAFTVGGSSRVTVSNSSTGYKGNGSGNIANIGQGNGNNGN